MSSLSENQYLNLDILAGKLATLLALKTLIRVSELAAIVYRSVKFEGEGVHAVHAEKVEESATERGVKIRRFIEVFGFRSLPSPDVKGVSGAYESISISI